MSYQMPADLEYVRMFMLFLIPANIAASWYTTPDCQIAMAICIYIIMQYGRKRRNGILAYSKSSYKQTFK